AHKIRFSISVDIVENHAASDRRLPSLAASEVVDDPVSVFVNCGDSSGESCGSSALDDLVSDGHGYRPLIGVELIQRDSSCSRSSCEILLAPSGRLKATLGVGVGKRDIGSTKQGTDESQ